jgi:uncharacterized protein YeaO (DUF488 family)
MTIRVVRLGSPRVRGEGLRIGTVRRPPRGVRKQDFAKKDIYDVWFPNLSPSATLLKAAFPPDATTWKRFKAKFLTEMKTPEARRQLELLAALSEQTNFSIGCYCEDKNLCHRSILHELLMALGADMKDVS